MTPISLARKIAADPTLAEKWLPHGLWTMRNGWMMRDAQYSIQFVTNAVAESAILWHWQTLIDKEPPQTMVPFEWQPRADALTAWVAQRTGVTA